MIPEPFKLQSHQYEFQLGWSIIDIKQPVRSKPSSFDTSSSSVGWWSSWAFGPTPSSSRQLESTLSIMTLDVNHHISASPLLNKSSFPSASLNTTHISEAIQRSSDNGATLMFSKMNLSDVGVLAAEELATIGRETPEDESPVKRYVDILNNLRSSSMPSCLETQTAPSGLHWETIVSQPSRLSSHFCLAYDTSTSSTIASQYFPTWWGFCYMV
jgi:hypothetical protein